MSDLITLEAEAWKGILADANVASGGSIVIRGPGANEVADAMRRLGAGTVVVADVARVTSQAPIDHVADLVVLLHAWESRSDLDAVVRSGTRALAPGGIILLAELDVDRLLSSAPGRFPSVLLYRQHPNAARSLAAASAPVVELVVAAVRAGIDEKMVNEVDRPVGVFRDPSEYRAALEFGVWREMDQLERADYEAIVEAACLLPRVSWPVVDQEPWLVVSGRARG